MNRTDKIICSAWSLWSCLGVYRGKQFYFADYNRQKEWDKNKHYYYTTSIGVSILGGFVYAFPVFMPGTILHEIYNLEKTIRGIESDD